jgi:hypothetical protein
MVSGISGTNFTQQMGMFRSSTPLTDDQKSQVESILEDYDPENLTADDAKSIMKSIHDAGIQPGKDLTDVLEASGFDEKEMLSLARPEGKPPMGPQGTSSSSTNKMDVSSLQTFKSILSQYDLTSMTEDDQDSLYSQLNQAGLMGGTGKIFDLSA